MKYNCDLISDLLPLYKDDICSDTTKKIVEEHIAESVELYPDEKDYDKAYYYVKEKLNEEREKEIESLRKKKNERVQQ